jgi:hypothetical protein
VKRYLQGKTPDSSTRVLCQSYQQDHLFTKQGEVAKEIMNSPLRSIIVHTSKGALICRKILRHGADGFTSALKEVVLPSTEVVIVYIYVTAVYLRTLSMDQKMTC